MTAAQDERRCVAVLYGPSTRSGTVVPSPINNPTNKLAATDRAGSVAA